MPYQVLCTARNRHLSLLDRKRSTVYNKPDEREYVEQSHDDGSFFFFWHPSIPQRPFLLLESAILHDSAFTTLFIIQSPKKMELHQLGSLMGFEKSFIRLFKTRFINFILPHAVIRAVLTDIRRPSRKGQDDREDNLMMASLIMKQSLVPSFRRCE